MLSGIFKDIYLTYLEIAPYLFIGLSLAGLLHIFFKRDLIVRHLGKDNFLSVVKASLLGVPLPLCSCGVIPTAIYLRKQKASPGATLSFLISTPQTGVDSILATYGMLGPVFAFFRPVAAFLTGIIGGAIANLSKRDDQEPNKDEVTGFHCDTCEIKIPHDHSFFEKIKAGMVYAYRDFLDDISIQLLFGVIIAGIITYAIPEDFFGRYGGNGFLGMIYMIIFGIPLYVCATASIPIAVSLILKGISPGAAFVFLVVGPATNAATIALIGKALGKKIILIYLGVISISALAGGFLLNWVFSLFGDYRLETMLHDHSGRSPVMIGLSVVFSIMLMLSFFRKIRSRFFSRVKYDEVTVPDNLFRIEGMTCKHCLMTVEHAIGEVRGVADVKVDLHKKTAVVEGEYDRDEVSKAIEKAGYRVV
ncbi:MAG: SO_0444 family Cu/Zn efflux transporter [Candidatus Cloacimonetes bacterium]|nr:SO_0444 family Cu/Zn efflux transporter [Candidatus Cloacimonadota bacterium]